MSRTGTTGLPLQSHVGDGINLSGFRPYSYGRRMHRRRAPSSTSCSPPPQANPEAPAIDDGRRRSPTRNCSRRSGRPRRSWPNRESAPATASASACRPAPARSTSRSCRSLAAGAAYVPVDADDPEERAELVFGEAQVRRDHHRQRASPRVPRRQRPTSPSARPPTADDDAWIIFTSGSTGTPKGVAVTHRNAAAFVDAEARMFLQDDPIGPGDRVLAGLSVAFDASCEEMWLAWRTAPASCRRPGPWCAAAWTSARGWSRATSPSSRRCRPSRRCGPPRPSKPCAC